MFNVSVTRAQALLIIIGNSKILKEYHSTWGQLISYCSQNKAIIRGNMKSNNNYSNLNKIVQKTVIEGFRKIVDIEKQTRISENVIKKHTRSQDIVKNEENQATQNTFAINNKTDKQPSVSNPYLSENVYLHALHQENKIMQNTLANKTDRIVKQPSVLRTNYGEQLYPQIYQANTTHSSIYSTNNAKIIKHANKPQKTTRSRNSFKKIVIKFFRRIFRRKNK